MISRFLAKPVSRMMCWYLVLVLAGVFAVPTVAKAAMIPSVSQDAGQASPEALDEIRTALEEKLVADRLASLGLSPKEIEDRLQALSPEEREELASNLDSIQAGGDSIVGLAIVALLVYLVLKLTDKI